MPGFNQQDGQQLTPDVIARRLNAVEAAQLSPVRPFILAQSAVPSILVPSGTSNASGLITLGTALAYQPVGVVQIYLPAGVVAGDAVGGLKPVVFSSTNVCQIVGSPATANASYTQTTGVALTLASIPLPGGALGPNGVLRPSLWWSHPANTNLKLERIFIGATSFADRQAISATQPTFREVMLLRNRGSQVVNLVESSWGGGVGPDTGQFKATTIDTSVAQSILLTGQIAVATDYVVIEGYTIEVLFGA